VGDGVVEQMAAVEQLKPKQRRFLEAYLTSWNATHAAEVAGYKHPRQQGSRLLTNVDIQAAIQERLSEAAMPADEVLARLTAQARADVGHFLKISDQGEVMVDLAGAKRAGLLHLVKKVGWDRKGNLVVELYDAQAALVHLGKHHGVLKERVNHGGEIGLSLPDALLGALEKVYGEGDEDDEAGDSSGAPGAGG
jgi:hypothetical protein